MTDEVNVAPRRCALYARVSTTKDQDPDVQLRQLRVFVEQRGWGVAGEYVDVGVSGAKASRPQLDRLLADARAQKFDVLVVWKLDRLFRSLKHLVSTLDLLKELGVGFVSTTEQMDVTTAAGRMVMSVIGAMAEFERALCCERIKAGVAKARAVGKRIGRPQRWSREDVDRAARLRASGASWREVSQATRVPVRTIRRALLTVAETSPA